MTEKMKKKYISDDRSNKSDDFPKLYDNNDIASLSSFIEAHPEMLNKTDSKGATLLFKAVVNGNYAIVEYLLERKADPNVQNIHGETALHQAVENGNHKVINLLLEKNADPNIQQVDGETPMHIASLKGDYKVIKLLNLYNADATIETNNGYTAIDYATEKNNSKCIDVLRPLMEKASSGVTGFQTSKNNDSPINRFIKESIGYGSNNPPAYKEPNNTVKNSATNKLNFNNLNFDGQMPNKKTRGERHRSVNINADNELFKQINDEYNNVPNNKQNTKGSEKKSAFDDSLRISKNFLNEMQNFEERLEKMKRELLILNSGGKINPKQDYDSDRVQYNSNPTFNKFIAIDDNNNTDSNVNISLAGNKINETIKNENILYTENENDNNDIACGAQLTLGSNRDYLPDSKGKTRSNTVNNGSHKSSATLPSYLNYANLVNSNTSRRKIASIESNDSIDKVNYNMFNGSGFHTSKNADLIKNNFDLVNENFNTDNEFSSVKNETKELKNFTFNCEDNRVITLRPDEFKTTENDNLESSRITYSNSKNPNYNEDIFNLPLQTRSINSIPKFIDYIDTDNDSTFNQLTLKMNKYVTEPFLDDNRVLAVFLSAKNDITERNAGIIEKTNTHATHIIFNKINSRSDTKNCSIDNKENELIKYANLFNLNLDDMNDFIQKTDDNQYLNINSDESEEEEENNDQDDNDKYFTKMKHSIDLKFIPISENKNEKLLEKNKIEDKFNDTSDKKGNFLTGTAVNFNMTNTSNFEKLLKKEMSFEYNSTEAIKEIQTFLKLLDLEKYAPLFIKNGFDDLQIVVEQMNSEVAISDQNLKDIGVRIPGHRAKILIKLEEESGNFDFPVPSNVYYTSPFSNEDLLLDHNIKILFNWLLNLKLEKYTTNFVAMGYHSLELLLLQMSSR